MLIIRYFICFDVLLTYSKKRFDVIMNTKKVF